MGMAKAMLANLAVALVALLQGTGLGHQRPLSGLKPKVEAAGEWVQGETIHRSDFPRDMVFGVSSSAYQYEGAVNEGGRGPCVWDTVAHIPGHTPDNSTGDLGVDQYHRYKEDVILMKDLQVDAYRFSISWSRIFPDGLGPNVNQEGVDYYNNLINELLAKGIQPYATLWHWDIPQGLQDAFGGWQSRQIVTAFSAFAEACFQEFGDRVKYWITMNEPHEFLLDHTHLGCKDLAGSCGYANTKDAPFIMSHHVILSHASAAHIYHSKYKTQQGGSIGITLDAQWFEPLTNSSEDLAAAERMQLFESGWFLDPFFFGDYPDIMRTYLGDRLPRFTEEESRFVQGSVDFVGINHYTSFYTTNQPVGDTMFYGNYFVEPRIIPLWVRNGVAIGPPSAISWLHVVPWGVEKILSWIKVRYDNPPVIITENGMVEYNDPSLTLDQALNDEPRIEYHRNYLAYVLSAVRAGSNLKGYFIWSMLDNFEWDGGYTFRFGLYYVDYLNNLKRTPKKSAIWYKKFLQQTEKDEVIVSLSPRKATRL